MIQVATTQITSVRIINQFTGLLQLDFVNYDNGHKKWSRNFVTREINELIEASKIINENERIEAIYDLVSSKVDSYIYEWEFDNK
jgi:hypothetical protein